MYNLKIKRMEILSNDRIAEIAREWCIPPAALLAVKLVESGNNKTGFIEGINKPIILFEGHIFFKLLKQNGYDVTKLHNSNPGIVYSKWDKSKYKSPRSEWQRLESARKINKDLANQSASWGMFQVMGFNYKSCGCTTSDVFVDLMSTSPEAQLELTLNFLKYNKMIIPLQRKNWVEFAKQYNGPGYTKNRYDIKLQNAYNNYVRTYPDK